MERYRLKNIIILILALLNAFLLVALGIRGTEEHTARRTQQQELVALFAADGMTLDPALIPADTELSAYTLLRDETLEKNAAAFWLGTVSERTAQGGGIYTYSGSHGAAVFRDTGSFDIAGTLSGGDAASLCRDFCKKFSYTEPAFTLDETGSGTATALRQWNGAPCIQLRGALHLQRRRRHRHQRFPAAGYRHRCQRGAAPTLRLRRPDGLSADAPRVQLRGLHHYGHQPLLRAAKHGGRPHGSGPLLAHCDGHRFILCKLCVRRRPPGLKNRRVRSSAPASLFFPEKFFRIRRNCLLFPR